MKERDSIIFDLDGTLWNASETVSKAFNDSIKEIGFDININAQKVRDFSGMKMDDIFAQHFSFIPNEKLQEFEKNYAKKESDYLKKLGVELFPNVKETLEKFLGEIDQKPPIFSAIKIEGNRAYDLARAGKEVEMKSRKTTIHYLKDVEIDLPFVRFTVGCSKGTYIRSLAHDIGQELRVGAYLTNLRRTKIGEYSIENASSNYLENDYRFSADF